jgi:hypothetical protein
VSQKVSQNNQEGKSEWEIVSDFRSAGIRFQSVHVGAVGQAIEAGDGALAVGTTVVRAILAQTKKKMFTVLSFLLF